MSDHAPPHSTWAARVFLKDPKGGSRPVGNAVLVDDRMLLTAAHFLPPTVGDAVSVTFPHSEDDPHRTVECSYEQAPLYVSGQRAADVGILRVRSVAVVPEDCSPIRLLLPRGHDLRGRRWWAYGFADDDDYGNSAWGTIGEALANYGLRLDCRSDYRLATGFSGAGV